MFRSTSGILKARGITGPTLVILAGRARANIRRMAARAREAGVVLRPHFKTHQDETVGGWFADAGVDRITVSSVGMAERFAAAGWRDITLAFLLNPLELPRLSRLAASLAERGGDLGVTIDSPAAARSLADADRIRTVWVKVDTGYGRTGIDWRHAERLRAACAELDAPPRGVLAHAGHSYRARGAEALQAIWDETAQRLRRAAEALPGHPLISVGDTPTCSAARDLGGVDEVRPGNFVFFDLMQLEIGSCSAGDLAAAVACPVVGLYPERRQAVIHGGAVHLSREALSGPGGPVFGRIGSLEPEGIVPGAAVTGLSQEHGTVTFSEGSFPGSGDLAVGDLLLVWPVHSCLTVNLMGCRNAAPFHILS